MCTIYDLLRDGRAGFCNIILIMLRWYAKSCNKDLLKLMFIL